MLRPMLTLASLAFMLAASSLSALAAESEARQGIFGSLEASGGQCVFQALDKEERLIMRCTPEQERRLVFPFAFVSYHEEAGELVLDEVIETELKEVQAQASFYAYEDGSTKFNFPHEDWDRKILHTPEQRAGLDQVAREPLTIVYYEDARQNYYLGSFALYYEEFTELMEYQEDDRDFLCGFYRMEIDEPLVMECSPEQRETIENSGPYFRVTFTDAGGYRLLGFEEVNGSEIWGDEDYYDEDYDEEEWPDEYQG